MAEAALWFDGECMSCVGSLVLICCLFQDALLEGLAGAGA